MRNFLMILFLSGCEFYEGGGSLDADISEDSSVFLTEPRSGYYELLRVVDDNNCNTTVDDTSFIDTVEVSRSFVQLNYVSKNPEWAFPHEIESELCERTSLYEFSCEVITGNYQLPSSSELDAILTYEIKSVGFWQSPTEYAQAVAHKESCAGIDCTEAEKYFDNRWRWPCVTSYRIFGTWQLDL